MPELNSENDWNTLKSNLLKNAEKFAGEVESLAEYQLDNGDGWPLDDSQTVLNSGFQTSFFWPQRELNLNQNAPAQKDATTYKIFWDNN